MKRVSSFTIMTLLLLAVTCFSITGTAFGQAKNQDKMQDAYREEMEEDYKKEIQELLEDKCLYYSGITMTKIIYEDGLVTYNMVIHNRSIDRMSYYEKHQLLKELQKIEFPDMNSKVSYEFLKI